MDKKINKMTDLLLNKLRMAVLCLTFFLSGLNLISQVPVLRVDLNIGNRQEAEVNEPEYIPWPINGGADSMTVEGVKIAFKNGAITYGWYKAGVQAPNYARLVNDGIVSDNVEMHLTGLQNGKHTLVTYHNTFDNPATNVFGPMDVYLNGVLTIDDLELTNRVLSNDASTTVFFELEVNDTNPIVIRFQSDPLPETTNENITICGFHLNTTDPDKLAKFQYPEHNDEHVNIDNDTLLLFWSPPANTVSQDIYFGINEMDVLTADTASPLFLGNQTDTSYIKTGFYSMDSYYWRVDPIDSMGERTKGDVWYFKKRIPSFPGAEGYGGYALGGRGGKVVYVTNLEDYHPDKEDIIPGSFRDVVENETGPRTILFKVSGIITLKDRMVIRDDYITVAGQSAPGKGICFRWAPIGVTGDNLIVQNIRVRLGSGVTYDGMGLTGAENSIIDHCSISWTLDEAFSSRGAKNITLQRSLISEALHIESHGFAASIGGDIGSFHHNLLAHCAGRNWSLAGGLDGNGYYAGRLDLSNNVVYNWGHRGTDGGAHEVNFVGNYYKKGPATTQNTILVAQLEGLGLGSQSYFYDRNIVENTDGTLTCDGTDNTCSRTYVTSNGQIVDWDVWADEPFFPAQVTIDSAKDAYKLVLSDVGCTQPVFDDHDVRIIDETLNGTTSCNGSIHGLPGIPDHEQDIGGWEEYPGYVRSAKWDTDLDGLPNWWEKAHGLDTNSAAGTYIETNADNDKNGYTNLEEYLQWMDNPHYFLETGENLDIDLSIYTRGFTDSPVFGLSDIVNGSANIDANSSIVHFSPVAEGMSEFKFTVTDAEGSSLTQKMGLYTGEMASDSMFSYSYYKDRDETEIIYVPHVTGTISHTADEKKHIDIFPNPADNWLTICFGSNATGEYSIFNIHSQLYLTGKLNNMSENLIDISGLDNGVYIIQIQIKDTGVQVFKFFKR